MVNDLIEVNNIIGQGSRECIVGSKMAMLQSWENLTIN